MANARLIGGGIGSALGVYSQTDDESYLNNVLGAGIGGAAGYYSSYDSIKNIQLTNKRTSLKYKVEQPSASTYEDLFNSTASKLDSRLSEIESLRRKATESFGKGFDGYGFTGDADRMSHVLNYNMHQMAGVGKPMVLVDTNRGEKLQGAEINARMVRDQMGGMNLTEEQLKRISQAIDLNDKIVSDQDLSGLAEQKKFMQPILMRANIARDTKLDIVTKHLTGVLGNPADVAAQKAEALIGALGSHDITLGEYSISARGDGGSVSFPLVGRGQDGERYSYTGNSRVISKQFNPLAKLYAEGKSIGGRQVQFSDVAKGMDPEMMLAFQSDTSMSGLKKTKAMMSSLLEYTGEDALYSEGKTSSIGMIKSNTIELGMTLDERNGELKWSKLGTMGRGDSASDINRFIQKFSEEAGYNPYERISHNAMTQIISPDFAGNWHPAAFPTEESGTSRINIRAQTPLMADNTGSPTLRSEYFKKKFLEGEKGVGDLISGSMQGGRMDVSDDVGKIASALYGSDITLDDGYSLFNAKHGASLAAQESISFDIPNIGTESSAKFNTTLSFSEIQKATQDGGGVRIGGEIIGYNKDDSPIRLGRQYTYADIDKIEKTSDGVRLIGKGTYMPSEGDTVKVFATASKSGGTVVGENIFNKIALIGMLHSEGNLTFDGKNRVGVMGRNMTLEELDRYLDSSNPAIAKKRQQLGGIFQIARADDTGLGDINKILTGTYPDADFAKKYGGIGQDGLVDRFTSSTDRTEKANIARTMLAITDNKANMDIWQSIGEHLTTTGQHSELANVERIKKSLSAATDKDIDSLVSSVSKTFNGRQSISNTTVTANVGPAISGAGNRGSISWLEQSKLMMDGMTKGDIRSLGKSNGAAMAEVQMMMDSTKEGNIDPDKLKNSRLLSGILSEDVSVRPDILRRAGASVTPGAQHLMYNLSEEVMGMKSVPMSLVDTGYSGVGEIDGESIVKILDKKRDSLISADLHLRSVAGWSESDRAPVLENYRRAAEDLSDTLQRHGGELVKRASKLEASNSRIMWAKPVGGNAQKYVDRMSGAADTASFMGRENAMKYLKGAGLNLGDDFSLEEVEKGVSRIKMKDGSYFMSQISREPVQGPGSSIASELLIDDSIKGKGAAIHFARMAEQEKQFLSIMAAMDFDGDSIRVAPIVNMSEEGMQRLKRNNSMVVETLSDVSDVIKQLSPKGSDKKAVSRVGMKDETFKKYSMAAAAKGRSRKPLAPLATKFSVNFQESINNSSLSQERKIRARELAHALSENALKSKHKDTFEFLNKPNGVLEGLMSQQESWLEKNTAASDSAFRTSLSGFLDETLGGKILSSGDETSIGKYTEMRNDLINSYVSPRTRDQLASNWSTTDIGKNAFDRDKPGIAGMVAATEDVMLRGGGMGSIVETSESTSTPENMAHKAKTIYNESRSQLMDFASKNKGKLLTGSIGLGALAMLSNSRAPEQSAATHPTTNVKAQPLEPLRDRKAYTREYKQSGENFRVVATARSDAGSMRQDNLNKIIHGNTATNAQVNITDRSGMF